MSHPADKDATRRPDARPTDHRTLKIRCEKMKLPLRREVPNFSKYATADRPWSTHCTTVDQSYSLLWVGPRLCTVFFGTVISPQLAFCIKLGLVPQRNQVASWDTNLSSRILKSAYSNDVRQRIWVKCQDKHLCPTYWVATQESPSCIVGVTGFQVQRCDLINHISRRDSDALRHRL